MLQILFILFSLSLDTFVVSFAYGTNKAKIPLLSQCIISVVSSLILLAAILLGTTIQAFFPDHITVLFCVALLLVIGSMQLIKSLLKRYLTHMPKQSKKIGFQFLGISFSILATLPPEESLTNTHTSISIKEAFYLGVALSIDNIAVGISLGLASVSYLQALMMAIAINLCALYLGNFLGFKLTEKANLNLDWLSGVILILLALIKLS